MAREYMSLRDNAWLAGFTAGEGSFGVKRGINRSPGNPKGHIHPSFVINLRADDLPVLESLRAEFGGTIGFGRRAKSPTARWSVIGKRDLPGLVAYFDRFPLVAKKARDYAIWRRMVEIYCREGGYAVELRVLADALCEAKRFVPVEVPKKREKKIDLACDFLSEMLTAGPVPTTVLYRESDFSRAVLGRAASRLGVGKTRRGRLYYWEIFPHGRPEDYLAYQQGQFENGVQVGVR